MNRSSLMLIALLAATASQAQDHGTISPVTYPDRASIRLSADIERAFDRSGQLVTRRTLPDGTEVAEHNGTMQNVTVARIGADGKIETFCTGNREAALDFLAGLDKQGGATRSTAIPGATR